MSACKIQWKATLEVHKYRETYKNIISDWVMWKSSSPPTSVSECLVCKQTLMNSVIYILIWFCPLFFFGNHCFFLCLICLFFIYLFIWRLLNFQGFFRRCITQGMSHKCANEEKCEITPFTRNSCQYCRLKKCFAVGMSREGKETTKSNLIQLSSFFLFCFLAFHKFWSDKKLYFRPEDCMKQIVTNHCWHQCPLIYLHIFYSWDWALLPINIT